MKHFSQLTNRYISKNRFNSFAILMSIVLTISILLTSLMIMKNIKAIEKDQYAKEFGVYDKRVIGVKGEDIPKLAEKDYIEKVYFGETKGIYNNIKPDGMDNIVEFYGLDKEAFNNMVEFNVVEGRLPQNQYEIMLSAYSLSVFDKDYNVGDTIEVNLETNRCMQDYNYYKNYISIYDKYKVFSKDTPLNGDAMLEFFDKTTTAIQSYKIVGIYKTSSENQLWNRRAITVMDETIDSNVKYELYIQSQKSYIEEDLAKTLNIKYIQDVRQNKEYGMESSYIKQNGYDIIASKKAEGNNGILFIVTIFCFFVIRNIINVSLSQKIKHYGILRAIGASSKQLAVLIIKEIITLFVVSIPFGIGIGYLLLEFVCKFINILFNINYQIKIPIDASTILGALGITFLICLITSYSILKKEMKLNPIDAIRDSKGLGKSGKLKIINFLGQELESDNNDNGEAFNELLEFEDKSLKGRFMNKLFGFEGRLANKNISRDRGRNNACIVSVTAAMFIIVLFFMQGLNSLTSAQYSRLSDKWELKVTNTTDVFSDQLISEIMRLDGVKNIYKDLEISEQVNLDKNKASNDLYKFYKIKKSIDEDVDNLNLNVNIRGLDDNSIEVYKDYLNSGTLDKISLDNNGVILVSNYTNYCVYGKGKFSTDIYKTYDMSKVYKVGDKIKLNKTNKELEIKAIVSVDAFENTASKFNVANNSADFNILVSEKVFKEISGTNNSDIIMVDVDNEKSQAVSEAIKNTFTKQALEVKDEKAYQEEILKEALESIGVNIMYSVIIMTLVIVNLIFTLTANILVRKGELATLTSIGMTSKQKSKMIISESIAMVLISLTAGVPISAYFIISSQLGQMSENIIPIYMTIMLVLVILAIISIIGVLASIAPLRIIKNQNIVDTLKEEV